MKKIVGIMGAMPEEIHELTNLLTDREAFNFGMRTYYKGMLNGIETIVVFSRWGKVAAATTVSTLILKFNITELVFTGVAGAIHANLNIGDIVIGRRLIQHDMDARPIMARHEIPLLNISYIESPPEQVQAAQAAITRFIDTNEFLTQIGQHNLDKFGITKPKLHIGDIASGDKFFASEAEKNQLKDQLSDVLCVEMEGAAVAQVCYEYNIPFSIIRTISDASDEQAEINFPEFIKEISSKYSLAIIRHLYEANNSWPA